MSFVLLLISLLLALLIVLLAVPVTVAFRVNRAGYIKGEINGQIKFRWLFGLVRFQTGVADGDKDGVADKSKSVKTSKRKRGSKSKGIISVLKQSAFRRRVIRFIKDVFRATHGRDLYLRLRIGLGDPAETGRLWMLLGPVAGFMASVRSVEVHIEAEYVDPVFEVESHGEFRLIPLQFIALATAFAVSPPTIRAWRTYRRSNA